MGYKKRRHGDAYLKHYVLHCIDGDDDVLTVCVNTVLNDRMGYVESGSILELIRFAPTSGMSSPTNVAVLVSNFNLLGTTISAVRMFIPWEALWQRNYQIVLSML